MAQLNVKTIKKIDKNINKVHKKVATSYTVFCEGGEKYVQIDTYGNADRINPDKASQSLQFDKESAKYLVKLLVEEFDLLD